MGHETVEGDFIDQSHLTNGEILEYSNPHEYRLPYIYDNFQWTHCEAAGYRFRMSDDEKQLLSTNDYPPMPDFSDDQIQVRPS